MDTVNNIINLFKYYTGLEVEKKVEDKNLSYNKKPDAYKSINSSSTKHK